MTFVSVAPTPLSPITSIWGNTIPLRNGIGRLRHDALRVVQAFMYFPDDPITAWSAIEMQLLLDEIGEGAETEPKAINLLRNSALKSSRQMCVAGMIGSALLVGAAQKEPISLRKAIAVVLKEIHETPELNQGNFPKHATNLRNCFSRFSPSIHFFLAELGLSAEEQLLMRETEEGLLHFLACSYDIMATLSARQVIENWRPWVVEPFFSRGNMGLEIIGLSEIGKIALQNYKADPDRRADWA